MAIFSNDTMVFQRVCHLLTTTIAFFLQLNHSNGTESSQIQNLPIVDSGLKWPKYIVESSTYCENFGRRGHCENRVFIHSGGRKTTFREAEGGFRGDFSPSQFTQFVRFCAKKKIIHSGLGCRTKCSQTTQASVCQMNPSIRTKIIWEHSNTEGLTCTQSGIVWSSTLLSWILNRVGRADVVG